ncbi:hypothetical protein L209DRAFT_76303 [Thermothelomyces heterothallicus CBS 203.75]
MWRVCRVPLLAVSLSAPVPQVPGTVLKERPGKDHARQRGSPACHKSINSPPMSAGTSMDSPRSPLIDQTLGRRLVVADYLGQVVHPIYSR